MKHVLATRVVLYGVLGLAGCSNVKFVHVPAGQSVLVATAPRAEAIPTPKPRGGFFGLFAPRSAGLPQGGTSVSDYYSIGVFCLDQGKNQEAIDALEKATAMDPGFGDAWNKLALAYQNAGFPEKAFSAYKRYKEIPHP